VYLEEGDSDVIDVVIQGDELDQETFAQLENVLPGENAVRIRLDIILGAIERYQEQQRH
jgi:hypothetical protein